MMVNFDQVGFWCDSPAAQRERERAARALAALQRVFGEDDRRKLEAQEDARAILRASDDGMPSAPARRRGVRS